ncbi:hypothetical protein ABUW04_21165 [Streptacidiphilus sp. N1-10]|uniref:Uncharacterized protein n=1 Tax=Streptacidiphilus jeojiensis TaxID=3229225 RepID=A0ABV6XRS3_9ACTN
MAAPEGADRMLAEGGIRATVTALLTAQSSSGSATSHDPDRIHSYRSPEPRHRE